MNQTEVITSQTIIELLIWIAVLTAIHIQRARNTAASQGPSPVHGESALNYGPFAVFAAFQIAGNLGYLTVNLLTIKLFITFDQAVFSYNCLYWFSYLFQTILVFYLLSALIRSCLQPLPGLMAATNIIFRWASILAFALAVTAHVPTLHSMSWRHSLTEIGFSFQFCVCSFEITFVWLLMKYMRRLGLFVRSRVVGFALGLGAFVLSAYLAGFANLVTPDDVNKINILTESVDILTAATWLYYIVMPEPKRQPHSLSPASSLMKWNEVALKLGMGGRQAEHVPFISGVESKVDAVLERFKARE